MIKCIIVDDEPLAQEVLERYIVQTDSLQLIKKCGNAFEAHDILQKEEIDLIFMDIKMPVVNGIDFIKSLRYSPAVIFTTAYSDYAVESYSIEAIDYLLKPITHDRFLKSIARFRKQIASAQPEQKNHIYIKVSGSLIKIPYREILFVQSMKDYLKVFTTTEKHLTHLTMKALMDLLPSDTFIRVHRSFIVHALHITSIGKKEIEINGFKIPIGDNYREKIKMIGGKIK